MPEGSFMWILDALRLQFPTARLMTYGSKTKLDGSQSSQTLRELGAQLRSELRTVRQQPRAASVISLPQTRPPNYKYIPSIFIAHSLGGLSVKEVSCKIKTKWKIANFMTGFVTRIQRSRTRELPRESPRCNILRCSKSRHEDTRS